MKKAKVSTFFAAVLMCVLVLQTSAAALELVPGGMTVGLEMCTKGVVVSRLTEVETNSGTLKPALDAGIQPGDCIVELGGAEICSGEDFIEKISQLNGSEIDIKLLRGEEYLNVSICPAKSCTGAWQLGMWLRDGASGIGTVTYYDPQSGKYGALGHGVNDCDSGKLLPSDEGTVSPSVVVDVIPGKAGSPGELCGVFDPANAMGVIESNTPFGIFGVINEFPGASNALETASDTEIRPGKAVILSNISGTDVAEYEIEIQRVNVNAADGKSLVIRVTDECLLRETGGIVQGMSGSPIIQNGKLVGAVTHVLVSDSSRGYGISIDSMLEAAA